MKDDLFTLYQFDRWANARVIEACRTLSESDLNREPVPGWNSVKSTLFHIAGAVQLWSRRFEGEVVTAFPPESDFDTLDKIQMLFEEGYTRIESLLKSSTSDDFARIRDFRNLKGESRRMPWWAALRHVVNHSTYHRGQIASKLKRVGVEPPVTDLAAWAFEQTEQGG